MKDYKLSEIRQICIEHSNQCKDCPLCAEEYIGCYLDNYMPKDWKIEKDKKFVRLPCDIGDFVFYVNKWAPTPRVERFVVTGFRITKEGLVILFEIDNKEEFLRLDKDVYFDKDAAQVRLQKVREALFEARENV